MSELPPPNFRPPSPRVINRRRNPWPYVVGGLLALVVVVGTVLNATMP